MLLFVKDKDIRSCVVIFLNSLKRMILYFPFYRGRDLKY